MFNLNSYFSLASTQLLEVIQLEQSAPLVIRGHFFDKIQFKNKKKLVIRTSNMYFEIRALLPTYKGLIGREIQICAF